MNQSAARCAKPGTTAMVSLPPLKAVFCTEQINKLRKVSHASTAAYPYIQNMYCVKRGSDIRPITAQLLLSQAHRLVHQLPRQPPAARTTTSPLHQQHAVNIAIGADSRNDASLQPREQWTRSGIMVVAAGSQSARRGATP